MTDLTDEAAIERQLILYCKLCDTKQFGAIGTDVFGSDGTADYGLGPVRGGSAIADHLSALSAGMDCTAHSISNVVIDVAGDVARSSVYVLAWGWLDETADRGALRPADYGTVAIYDDEWRRGPHGWRITQRLVRLLGPGAVAVGALPGSLSGIGVVSTDP
jgi:hypothetical protein